MPYKSRSTQEIRSLFLRDKLDADSPLTSTRRVPHVSQQAKGWLKYHALGDRINEAEMTGVYGKREWPKIDGPVPPLVAF